MNFARVGGPSAPPDGGYLDVPRDLGSAYRLTSHAIARNTSIEPPRTAAGRRLRGAIANIRANLANLHNNGYKWMLVRCFMKRATLSEIEDVITSEVLMYQSNDWCYGHLSDLFESIPNCRCLECREDDEE